MISSPFFSRSFGDPKYRSIFPTPDSYALRERRSQPPELPSNAVPPTVRLLWAPTAHCTHVIVLWECLLSHWEVWKQDPMSHFADTSGTFITEQWKRNVPLVGQFSFAGDRAPGISPKRPEDLAHPRTGNVAWCALRSKGVPTSHGGCRRIFQKPLQGFWGKEPQTRLMRQTVSET